MSYIEGKIDLKELGINIEDVIGFDILKGKVRDKVHYSVEGNKVNIDSELKLNTNYGLRVITDKERYSISFKSSDLPEIKETGDAIIVKVPAMPEKGFNWPYYLRIPSNAYKSENNNTKSKRYLMVDSTNSGSKGLSAAEAWVADTLKNKTQYSVNMSEELWVPTLMPVFPNTNIDYINEDLKSNDWSYKWNAIYENAYDRDTAILHNLLKHEKIGKIVREKYNKLGYNADDFVDLGSQLSAMFDHAVEYLNKYGHNVETDKMFFYGFSATGTFGNRYATLYPEKVKAVFAGAALDDLTIPSATYKGEELMFPIGVHDYKEITGREFDLN